MEEIQEKGEVAEKGGQKGNSNEAKEEKPISHDETFVSEKHLSEVGITHVQSHRWKTLADMPEQKIRAAYSGLDREKRGGASTLSL